MAYLKALVKYGVSFAQETFFFIGHVCLHIQKIFTKSAYSLRDFVENQQNVVTVMILNKPLTINLKSLNLDEIEFMLRACTIKLSKFCTLIILNLAILSLCKLDSL